MVGNMYPSVNHSRNGHPNGDQGPPGEPGTIGSPGPSLSGDGPLPRQPPETSGLPQEPGTACVGLLPSTSHGPRLSTMLDVPGDDEPHPFDAPDDFADDPDYQEVRRRLGPQVKFELGRREALQHGYQPWPWQLYEIL